MSTDYKESATCTVRCTRGSTEAPGKVDECCRDIYMLFTIHGRQVLENLPILRLILGWTSPHLGTSTGGESCGGGGLDDRDRSPAPRERAGRRRRPWTRTRRPKTTVSQALARSGGGSVSPAVAQVCVRPCGSSVIRLCITRMPTATRWLRRRFGGRWSSPAPENDAAPPRSAGSKRFHVSCRPEHGGSPIYQLAGHGVTSAQCVLLGHLQRRDANEC
jgi:hypothetical protein